MKKVFVKLKGGLGNQLFQYAFGEYLKNLNDSCEIIYETSYFKNKNSWDYDLEKLNLEKLNYINHSVFRQKLPFYKVIKESKSYHFQKVNVRDGYTYDGYWQNPKYLMELKDLKNKFSLRTKPEFNSAKNGITKIGVHVRRGDYVGNIRHDVLNKNYHLNSIKEINRLIEGEKKFYVFSDDLSYCKKKFEKLNFKFIYVDYLNSSLLEFDLLKKMDHLIISNSSFSWWAAYLSDNKEKITICPEKWVDNENKIDLMLENWIRM